MASTKMKHEREAAFHDAWTGSTARELKGEAPVAKELTAFSKSIRIVHIAADREELA